MLTQIKPSVASMTALPRHLDRAAEHHSEFPPHVERFLELLQTSWPTTAPWDEETDTVAYGRQVIPLTREQTREIYYRLRERHTFRPSVAEVRIVVDEMTAPAPMEFETAALRFEMSPETAARVLADPNASPENITKARRVLPHGALPATGEGVGRSRAREILNDLRRRSWLPEKESGAATAKYSTPNNPTKAGG